MGDQGRHVEIEVGAGIRMPERVAIQRNLHVERHFRAVPCVAERLRRRHDRRKCRRRLALKKAETLAELGRDQVAQADVVENADKLDVAARVVGGDAHRHVVENDENLRLHVDSPRLVGKFDVVPRPDHRIRRALVHQRVRVEVLRHLRAARLADQLDMVEIGAAVDPLIGARQDGRALRRLEREGPRFARVHRGGEGFQPRRRIRPVVDRRLHRGRHGRGVRRPREIVAHRDEATVATALERCELHASIPPSIPMRMPVIRRARMSYNDAPPSDPHRCRGDRGPSSAGHRHEVAVRALKGFMERGEHAR